MNFLSVMDMVVFYFAFGEKTSKLHLIGVALIFLGIACTAVAVAIKDPGSDDEVDEGSSLDGFLAILIGMGGPTIIAIQHYFIRRFSGKYSGFNQALDFAPTQEFILIFFLIPLMDKMTITWGDIAIGGLAGILMEAGRIGITYAVDTGVAGPAVALMNTNAMY